MICFKIPRSATAMVILFCCWLATDSFAVPPAGYYLVWNDEFNDVSLDTTKWDYWLLGHRRDAVNVTNAVSLNGSNLVITTYTTNGIHYSGFVATDQKFRSRYGYWESSIKWALLGPRSAHGSVRSSTSPHEDLMKTRTLSHEFCAGK